MRLPLVSACPRFQNWVSGIKESSFNGRWAEVLSYYSDLARAGVKLPEPSFIPPIIKACLGLGLPFRQGMSLHASLIKQGYDSFTSISNAIMDFYVKNDDLGSALRLFESMKLKDSVTWNIIIGGCLKNGVLEEGLGLFMEARRIGSAFEPNISTILLVIQAQRVMEAFLDGQMMHGHVIRTGFWTVLSVQNSILSVYADVQMDVAQKLFDEMCDRDVISWSVMIGGYVKHQEAWTAIELFGKMVSQEGIEVDGQTMASVIKVCSSLEELKMARLVHGFVIRKGFVCDMFVGNSLIDMYSKCEDLDSAFKVFTEMPQKNVVSWNSLLSGFVHDARHGEAVMLFNSMVKGGISADEVTLGILLQICKYFVHAFHCKAIHSVIIRSHKLNELILTSLIDAYAKCGLIVLAWKLFSCMKGQDVVTWSTMISGFTYCGMPPEAIAVFREMNHVHMKPNAVTILNLLEACSVYAELKISKWAHGIAVRSGLASKVEIGTAILDMYSKCGAIEASKIAFNQIPIKSVVSWSAMIAACGMNGLARDALVLFTEMKEHDLKPNAATMLSVLSACSHGGLVEEGLFLFQEFVKDYMDELRLEHFSCIVDLLARAGKLDRAMEFIEMMPDRVRAGASAWGAVLSACSNYKDIEFGAEAIPRLIELEPTKSAGYVLASQMHATWGSWADAAIFRWLVRDRGVGPRSGYSLLH